MKIVKYRNICDFISDFICAISFYQRVKLVLNIVMVQAEENYNYKMSSMFYVTGDFLMIQNCSTKVSRSFIQFV